MLTGCYKDGIDPPTTSKDVSVAMLIDLHCDGKPFHRDSTYTDGFGTHVRFDQVRFALVGVSLLGDQGQPMGDQPASVIAVDLDTKSITCPLNTPVAGAVHWLDTRTARASDAHTGTMDSLWTTNAGVQFLAMLDIRGIVDSNEDGRFDDHDPPFHIIAATDSDAAPLRIHAHGDLPAGGAGSLVLSVNITALLHDIDLPDAPMCIGSGPYASQAIHNLRTCVLGADNRPN